MSFWQFEARRAVKESWAVPDSPIVSGTRCFIPCFNYCLGVEIKLSNIDIWLIRIRHRDSEKRTEVPNAGILNAISYLDTHLSLIYTPAIVTSIWNLRVGLAHICRKPDSETLIFDTLYRL